MTRSLAPTPRWRRAYVSACAGVIGFSIAYVLCHWAEWPKLTYFPYEGEWRLASAWPGPVPMSYVGTALWGLGGAACGAAPAWVASARIRGAISDRWLRLWGGWALAAFAYAGLYYTWSLWPF